MSSAEITEVNDAVDTLWISISTFLVFFMQAGFAFLEAGSVREKNVQNILIKNMLDICACTIAWWFLGYGFAFGKSSNGFIGSDKFATHDYSQTDNRDWMFQWAFAGTSATIVSGCLAERTHILAYLFYSIFITIFIYPVVVHWTWGTGWLYDMDYIDFAGSGIVHMVGGVAGLVGCYIVGPRIGRFESERKKEFQPHNVPMVVLGTLILWFGWYGFNCGSTLGATGSNSALISVVAINTTLAAATAGLVCFIYNAIVNRSSSDKYSIVPLTNGILGGLVSITAGCSNVEPYSAFVIGLLGAFVYIGFSKLVLRFNIDDPLDAFAVHGGCGIWGVIAVAFFDKDYGIFYGDDGNQLGVQLLAIVVICTWTAALSAITFNLLKRINILRISREEEERGMDIVEHGGNAYHIKGESPNTIHPIVDQNGNTISDETTQSDNNIIVTSEDSNNISSTTI